MGIFAGRCGIASRAAEEHVRSDRQRSTGFLAGFCRWSTCTCMSMHPQFLILGLALFFPIFAAHLQDDKDGMLAYWSIKMYKFQCGWPHHKTGHCGVRTPTCAPHFSTTSSWEAVGMSSTAKRGELNSSDHSELGRQGLRGV